MHAFSLESVKSPNLLCLISGLCVSLKGKPKPVFHFNWKRTFISTGKWIHNFYSCSISGLKNNGDCVQIHFSSYSSRESLNKFRLCLLVHFSPLLDLHSQLPLLLQMTFSPQKVSFLKNWIYLTCKFQMWHSSYIASHVGPDLSPCSLWTNFHWFHIQMDRASR